MRRDERKTTGCSKGLQPAFFGEAKTRGSAQHPDEGDPHGSRGRLKDQSHHRRLLIEGIGALGIRPSDSQIQALQSYLAELMRWNQRLNLTAIREPDLMIRRHIIDCASVIRFLAPDGHILDVGSGAGLPGIPIKILLPEKKVTLLECRRKRANFLRHVVRALRLTDTRILEQRIETLPSGATDPLNEMIARAFTDYETLLRASAQLLSKGGKCLIMHGPQGIDFLENNRNKFSHLHALPPESFTLPFGAERRTVLLFEKLDDVSRETS